MASSPIKPIFLTSALLFLLSTLFFTSHNYRTTSTAAVLTSSTPTSCVALHSASDKCAYVKSHHSCSSGGYFNYLQIFYCNFNNLSVIGYSLILVWLVILFYLLGNTASAYFCPAVEGLSRVLKLSPTISGTTLLPFGNGANDVFASVIAFTRSGDSDVGVNSVLGGAFFICCFVVGIVSISVSSRMVTVDKRSFVRDVLFFLFALCCLLTIVVLGEVNFWLALCFVSIYLIYIAVVSVMQLTIEGKQEIGVPGFDEFGGKSIPLLGYADEENLNPNLGEDDKLGLRKTHGEEQEREEESIYFKILSVLEFPIYMPRRITIPIVSEENWSKSYAVCSSIFAPILLALIYITSGQKNNHLSMNLGVFITSSLIGTILGTLAFIYTKKSEAPTRFLLLWLSGSFLMSIVWTYLLVEELVSLLIALANILGISPSILGLTVLAWGNSMGDLISNLTLALKDGVDGAQMAVSGCYAGPLFNTLVGLGLSLVFASWESNVEVPSSRDVYETVGFLMVGLLWALVVLPKRNMQLDKFLGVGLLAIYLCFLFVRLVKDAGFLNFGG